MNLFKRTGSALGLSALFFSGAMLGSITSHAGVAALGDANFDGKVDIEDSLMIARKSIGMETPEFPNEVGDVNCDNKMDIVDALMVSRYSVGMQEDLECAYNRLFIDDRDQQAYPMVNIGNQTWMAKNMNYNDPDTYSGTCYDDEQENCDVHGRFYSPDTANEVCPSGWHLPTDKEWDQLLNFPEDTNALKSTDGWEGNGTDKYGFAAKAGGILENDAFNNLGTQGRWWSSSMTDGMYHFTDWYSTHIDAGETPDGKMHVRCIKDARAFSRKALVAIVDNSKSMADSQLNTYYESYPSIFIPALAKMYGVSESDITGMTLTEVVEEYGEDWVISDIENTVDGHYVDYISLTDSDATMQNFLEAVQSFSDQGYEVDIMMNLHGSATGSILFYDGSFNITEVTGQIQAGNMNISAVYQTMCYGSETTDEWERIGVHAVNGSIDQNMFVNFAPGAFLKRWIGGMDYDDAVMQARLDDMNGIKEQLIDAGLASFLVNMLMSQFKEESQQTVAGLYPHITW